MHEICHVRHISLELEDRIPSTRKKMHYCPKRKLYKVGLQELSVCYFKVPRLVALESEQFPQPVWI